MAVSVLLVTHNNVGQSLLETARATLGHLDTDVRAISVRYDTDPDELLPQLRKMSAHVETSEGMLVLTDMFGSTPSNLAQALQEEGEHIRVVAGLNLPMLIRVLNYPQLSLDELAKKAYTGGREGVFDCESCPEEDHHA